jgi:hypothetical protein
MIERTFSEIQAKTTALWEKPDLIQVPRKPQRIVTSTTETGLTAGRWRWMIGQAKYRDAAGSRGEERQDARRS